MHLRQELSNEGRKRNKEMLRGRQPLRESKPKDRSKKTREPNRRRRHVIVVKLPKREQD